MLRYTAFFILLISITSCQKVINVNLNASDPQYVIEGNVTDRQEPQTVSISRSVNFSETNQFPQVTGALVTITDETAGITDTLTEVNPGTYQTRNVPGVSGHAYSLYINANGRVFTSRSVMPKPVAIDSIGTEKSVFGGDDLYAKPYYTDPVETGNCYRLTQTVNRRKVKGWDVRNDDVTNGQTAKFPFYYDTDDDANPKIKVGDSIFVTLQTIDRPVYEFYRTLEQTMSQNSTTQANPISNIAGGALGYFSASTLRETGAIVK
jgi:hypothetical protein